MSEIDKKGLSVASTDGAVIHKERAAVTIEKQAYITFGIVALALLMSSIDTTIVSVGLPVFLTDLDTNLAMASWTLAGYQFSQSIIMPIAGKLSDDWGRKKLFLTAVAVFTISSLAAGLAPNIYMLIIFRVIQGMGGGAFMPSATGIVSDAFGSKRTQAIGLFASIFPIGGIIGPNIGGFIIDHFSWRWIFIVNVPIGILLLVSGTLLLKENREEGTSLNGRIDYIGVGLFVGAVFAVLYGITNWANNPGTLEITTWVLFAVAIVLFVLFTKHENKMAQPMIDIKLLRWRPFLAVNIYNFLFGAVVFGLVSYIPYYGFVAYGMNSEEQGLLLTPRSIAMIIVSAITSLFIIRFRYRLPMIAGLLFMAVSLFLLSRGFQDASILGIGLNNVLLLSLMVGIAGIGMGLANPASNNAALDLIPEKVAAVAGIRGMARAIGGVIGTAIVSLILTFFPDKARGMQDIYMGFVFLLIILIPVVFMIPDSARNRRKPA